MHWLYHLIAWTWGGDGQGGAEGTGYLIVSGPFPCVVVLGGLYTLLRRHNCAVKGCWRIAFHHNPEHGFLVCRRHLPTDCLPKES